MKMDEQVSASTPPNPLPLPRLSPEQLEYLKSAARETRERSLQVNTPPPSRMPQQVVYVRRNFTVAELLLLLLLSCGLVTGIQALWNYGSRILPQIEIKVK